MTGGIASFFLLLPHSPLFISENVGRSRRKKVLARNKSLLLFHSFTWPDKDFLFIIIINFWPVNELK